MKRLVAIGFIWLGCAIAWVILGSTILARTGEASSSLMQEVWGLWGPPMQQAPPRAVFVETKKKRELATTTDAAGRAFATEVVRDEDVETEIALDESDVAVKLALAHRQKGLLWFATYAVDFRAQYDFVNDSGADRTVIVRFPLGNAEAVYDGFEVRDEHGDKLETRIAGGVAEWRSIFRAGEHRRYAIAYRSRGTERWGYQLLSRPSAGEQRATYSAIPSESLGGTGQVRAFHLAVDADFGSVDFPAGTLSPSTERKGAGGWHGEWKFSSLVASQPIGITLPQKLNPGPLASKITFFAPVGLLFFFFVVAVLAAAGQRRIHPLNYFFFGCAFFAFHLLFAYLVDHVAIVPAFALSSLVSLALVVSYARLFVGWRFALGEMAAAQLIYLVLFSFTFFWSGFTGLAITTGAILTLFVIMQLTGRIRWDDGVTGSAASDPTARTTTNRTA
ncbi:MAG TPA: inner membrane CreD family protein [Polyangia bacterium]